jgi:hypothetical protein
MGKQVAPEHLFYDFRLDDHVPADTCCGRSMSSSIKAYAGI